ncbi:MAG: STAS domain-containing protein [Fibrobacteres bacterium]|nr:STAS domain-containing protein [Fibrobacterota bacterium]
MYFISMEQVISIDAEERGTYYYFKFTGVLSAQTVIDVRHSLEKAIETGANKLGIDLSAITHIDSTGLGLLINLSKKLAKEGGQCIVASPSSAVMLVMKATNTDRVLNIAQTVELMESQFDTL